MTRRARGRPPAGAWALALLSVLASPPALAGCGRGSHARLADEARVGGVVYRVTELDDLSRARDVFRSGRSVYSSTDRGLYVYPTSGPPRPTRLGLAAGLPSDDVLATRVLPDDALAVLTSLGLVRVEPTPTPTGGEGRAHLPPAPLGPLSDIEVYDGLLYACGELGLARYEPAHGGRSGWRTLSDLPPAPEACHALSLGRGDTLWVLRDDSLAQLDGDELREHRPPAFPPGRPRAVTESADGDVFALLETEAGGTLARYTAGAWWSYSAAALEAQGPLVGLVAQAGVPLLVTTERVFALGGSARGAIALRPLVRHVGRALRSRASPRQPRSTAPASVVAQRPRSLALQPATTRAAAEAAAPSSNGDDDADDIVSAAPRLFARALPAMSAVFEAAFASGDVVYLAARGRGLVEVSEARRPLSAGDFREARPLAVALDEREGTWLRADDGSLVRVEDAVARVYPHGRVSALLESQDAAGAPLPSEPWAALMDGSGEALLAVPAPSGWVERARLSADVGLHDVRIGVREERDHLWLAAHGQRAEWPRGWGLAYRGPSGQWTFLDVPLAPRGALEAITHLVVLGAVAFAGGPSGLARVPAEGPAEVLFEGPVSDIERSGARVLFVSHGHLYALPGDHAGARPRALSFEEDAAEALRRVNAAGLALTTGAVAVVGEGGLALGLLDPSAPSVSPRLRWRPLERGEPLEAHDVEAGQAGSWVARRDGALFVLDPRGPR